MAIYHLTSKAFGRSGGHSSTAAAAYRAGEKITDARTGVVHDYTKRAGVAATRLILPGGGTDDRSEFWNRIEQHHKRGDAVVAREIEVSLPNELDAEQRQALAFEFAQGVADRYGVAADVAIHEPSKKGDERNHHAHILLSACTVDATGTPGKKCVALDPIAAQRAKQPAPILAERERWAEAVNRHLALARQSARVDHRSLTDQAEVAAVRGDLAQAIALAREPTQHEGKTTTAAKRAGHVLDRARFNDAVRAANRDSLADYLAKAEAEGRLHPPTLGQQAQAIADATKTPRQTPTGPLVERAVEGYTTIRNGKPVSVGGYTRQQRSAAPAASPKAGRGPVLPRGVSHAPSSPPSRSGGGLERQVSGGGIKTKEQRAEEARQAEARRLVIQQMNHEQRLLEMYLAGLEASGQSVRKATEEGLRLLVDDHQPLTPQAVRFHDWLGERAFIAGALDQARAEPGKRQAALTEATASLERRRQRLDDHNAQPEEAKPEWWKSKRAWAERRRERDTWQKQLERKVRHAIKREDAARAGLSTEALDEIEQRIDAASVALARHDASRARLFPDAELPRPGSTAPEPSTPTPIEPRPDNPAQAQRQQQRSRVNLTPRPELRPRR